MRSSRGYTLIELAVAAFATLLMVTAMVRWTYDVAAFGQSVLTGRDDMAFQAAFLLMDSDLAAAVHCGEPQASSRIGHLDGQKIVLPAVSVGEGSIERVEWRIHSEDGDAYSLQRAAAPVLHPEEWIAELDVPSCRDAYLPVAGQYEWGTLLSGLDAESEFSAVTEGAVSLPGACPTERTPGCMPNILQMNLYKGGSEFFRRSFLLPAGR